jgi:large subunit ribosomal protein L17
MRHRRKFNHLSRKSAHRKAMLSNMASSLILHKRIHTTLAKAKALRTYIEPLITKSKEDTTHSRRIVFSYLQSKEAVTELFREVSQKVAERPGGYTRIIKLPNRLGDNAEMCMMELVDYNENLLAEKEAKPKSTRRRRGSAKKKEEQVGAETVVAEKAVQETTEVGDEAAEIQAEGKTEETVEDLVAEAKVEEKVEQKVEEKAEAPVEEVKEEEPKAEEKKEEVQETEEPNAEAEKEASKEEEKKSEEPQAEMKEETKVEDKKEEEAKDRKEVDNDSEEKKKDDTK